MSSLQHVLYGADPEAIYSFLQPETNYVLQKMQEYDQSLFWMDYKHAENKLFPLVLFYSAVCGAAVSTSSPVIS